MTHTWNEPLEERHVTYTLELAGRFFIVENVPARVNVETGEHYFSPETVERLQAKILGSESPKRLIETPVYDYAE